MSQHHIKFKNGLTLLYLHTENDPVSAAHLFLPAGSVHDPIDKKGLATHHWSLLNKGSTKRSAREIAEYLEGRGASLGGGATHDYSEISCHSAYDYFSDTLKLMAENLFHPAFLPAEIEKEKQALLAGVRARRESIFTVAFEEFNRALYQDHPYAHPVSGTEISVTGLTRGDLLAWHAQHVQPKGAVLSVATSVPYKELFPVIDRLFGAAAWPNGNNKSLKFAAKPKKVKAAHHSKQKEKFEQAYVLKGYLSESANSKDYLAYKVLNGVLGGGMSARLFQTLREQQGLAYDVGSFFATKRDTGPFVIHLGLQESNIPQAHKGIEEQLELIVNKDVPARELIETKNYLKGTYILDHQTNSQRAHYLGWWEILGLGYEFDRAYLKKLSRVSATDVRRVAKKVFNSHPVTVEILPK